MKKLFILLFVFFSLSLSLADISLATTNLSLSTAAKKITKNVPFDVAVNITSTDSTLGTDLVLNYDPAVFEVTAISPGKVYPNYSPHDQLPQGGTIYISGVSDFTQGTTPTGTFATITFKPLKTGSTEISVAYDPQDPTSTGVIPFTGEELNLLTQAPSPLNITVKPANIFSQIWQIIASAFSFLIPKKL